MISLFINLGMKKFSLSRLNFKNSQCFKSYLKNFCNSKKNSVGLIDIGFFTISQWQTDSFTLEREHA